MDASISTAASKTGVSTLFSVVAASVGLILMGGVVLVDAVSYHECAADKRYLTPWYDARWYAAPYTHLMLSFRPSKEYWKANGDGSERWLIREVQVGDVTFWTTLERAPVAG